MLNKQDKENLVRRAKEARELAYAPYSHYKVGAAVLTAEGRYSVETTSRTPPIHPPCARSEWQFSRQFRKDTVCCRPSPW
jgi:cytidine deaminase